MCCNATGPIASFPISGRPQRGQQDHRPSEKLTRSKAEYAAEKTGKK